MNLLQKLQEQKLSEMQSIINNLELLLNTYSLNNDRNMSFLPFGIDYLRINNNQILDVISKYEPRIKILNDNINIEKKRIEFEFVYKDNITLFVGGK